MTGTLTRLSEWQLEELKRNFDLVERIRQDVPDLKRQGREWLGRCPFHGGRSFTVIPEKRFWYCFGCGQHGDAIKYLREISGCSFLEAVAEMNGGIAVEVSREVREARALEDRRREEDIARQQQKKRLAAHALWKSSLPIAGTPAERYLTGRGLAPPFPPTLRFQPRCKARWQEADPETGEVKDRSATLPALIALVMASDRTLATVHRIYLDRAAAAGEGPVGKATDLPPEDVKKLHGPPLDGAVRLSEPADDLVLTEGVETGLAVLEALRARAERKGLPVPAVWSAISAGQLLRIRLGQYLPRRIVVMADHDATSGTGERMAVRACHRFEAMGIPALWRQPNQPGDWLDVLCDAKRRVA